MRLFIDTNGAPNKTIMFHFMGSLCNNIHNYHRGIIFKGIVAVVKQ